MGCLWQERGTTGYGSQIILSRQQKHLQGKVFLIVLEKGETYQVLSYRMPVWWRKKEVEEEAMVQII